jgi:hypothetical protein
MFKMFPLAAMAIILAVGSQTARAVDPDVVGPARRGAAAVGNAAGAPGVENRIERREELRDLRRADVNPNAAARANARANNDAWRMRYHGNQWWYYTPQNNWMYYRNNNWSAYDANTYRPLRYSTGYRGYGGRGVYGPPTVPYQPYSNTPAGNAGANIGAGVGAAVNGPTTTERGAALGAAVGNAIGAGAVPQPGPER